MQLSGGGRRAVRAEINVTPLVDVVLVLLIIFMVITPLMIREMDVAVPPKAEIEPPPEIAAKQVVLRFTRDRQISINDELVAWSAVADKLKAIYQYRVERILFFDIEDGANYGETVQLMDVARAAGVDVLGIVTK